MGSVDSADSEFSESFPTNPGGAQKKKQIPGLVHAARNVTGAGHVFTQEAFQVDTCPADGTRLRPGPIRSPGGRPTDPSALPKPPFDEDIPSFCSEGSSVDGGVERGEKQGGWSDVDAREWDIS
eukprot:176703-Amorphochlora_amoeboformis.AAC.1